MTRRREGRAGRFHPERPGCAAAAVAARRRRGLTAGEFVVALAECLLADGDFLADLDHARADRAGAVLRAVPRPPASTTAGSLARRFGADRLAGVEAAWAR